MKHSITAIDIGSSKVCGVSGFVDPEGTLHVSSCYAVTSTGVTEGVITNMEATTKSIKKVITELEYENGGRTIDSVYIAISGRKLNVIEREEMHIRANHHTEITSEELDRYINELNNIYLPNDEVIVDIIPMGYQLDGGVLYAEKPIGLDCREIKGRYKIVTCEQRAFHYLERCLNKCGLNIAGKVLSAEAAGWACLNKEERNAGAAVIDIGSNMTDISFFKKGLLVDVQVLPIGGEIITSDISKGCRLIFEQAEMLKIGYGCATVNEEQKLARVKIEGFNENDIREISFFNLAQIIKARMDDISGLVDEVITQSGLRRELLAGLVITGGASKMVGAVDNFAAQTGLNIRSSNQQVRTQYKPSTQVSDKLDASYTVALGTLIKIANGIAKSIHKSKVEDRGGELPVLPPLNDDEVNDLYDNDDLQIEETNNKENIFVRLFNYFKPKSEEEEFEYEEESLG